VKAVADGIEAGKQKVTTGEMAAKRAQAQAEEASEAPESTPETPETPETPAEHEVVEPGEATAEVTTTNEEESA
jgi:hypothetical protein